MKPTISVGSLKPPKHLNGPLQESVVAAEQEAHEANLATAHCAKEAAVAKHEANLAVEWLGPGWLVTNLWNYWIYLWNSFWNSFWNSMDYRPNLLSSHYNHPQDGAPSRARVQLVYGRGLWMVCELIIQGYVHVH